MCSYVSVGGPISLVGLALIITEGLRLRDQLFPEGASCCRQNLDQRGGIETRHRSLTTGRCRPVGRALISRDGVRRDEWRHDGVDDGGDVGRALISAEGLRHPLA